MVGKLYGLRALLREHPAQHGSLGPGTGYQYPLAKEGFLLVPPDFLSKLHHPPNYHHHRRAEVRVPRPFDDIPKHANDSLLVGFRAPLHHRRGHHGRHPFLQQLLHHPRQCAPAHHYHQRATCSGQHTPGDGGFPLLCVLDGADHGEGCCGIAVGEGDPGVRGRGHGGGDAGYNLERNPCHCQHLRFLTAPSEYEWVPALEPHHPLALVRPVDEDGVDAPLPRAALTRLLPHVNELCVLPHLLQQAAVHQPIVGHHVGLAETLQALDGYQPRVSRPGPHQRHDAQGLYHARRTGWRLEARMSLSRIFTAHSPGRAPRLPSR